VAGPPFFTVWWRSVFRNFKSPVKKSFKGIGFPAVGIECWIELMNMDSGDDL
jgi:hypothetical protein